MSRWYVDQKETRNVGRRIGAGAAILLLALGGTSGMAARAAPACPQSVGTRCSTAPSAPSTRQSSAAPAAQARAVPDGTVATISVAARLTKYYPHIPGIYNLGLPRLVLHITGSGFVPGSKIRLAVMTTSPWKVLVKSWTYAQEAVITTWCGDQQRPCSQPNPLAGTIDYQMHLDNPPAVSNLEVLFRSAGHTGVHEVRLP